MNHSAPTLPAAETGTLWIVKGDAWTREWGRGDSEMVTGHHQITPREAALRAVEELSRRHRPPSAASRSIYRAVFRPDDLELTPDGELRSTVLGEVNTDLRED